MQKVTLNQVKDIIQDNINSDYKNEEVYLNCKDVLRNYDGKALNKKFYKDINKVYPEAYLKTIANMLYLVIPENNNQQILLTHGETFNVNDLNRKNTCFINSEHKRIDKNANLLNDKSKLNKIVKTLNSIIELNDFLENELDSYDNPSRYDIINLIKLEIKKIRE